MRYLISLIIICCLLQAAAVFSHTAHAEEAVDVEQQRIEEQARLQKQINEGQIRIRQLQAGIDDQMEGLTETKQKEDSILSEMEGLDQKIQKMSSRLTDLDDKMAEQHILIQSLEDELADIRRKTDAAQRHVEKRISAYYKLGKIDLMNITFSTRTLPELLRFHDAFSEVMAYDQEVMSNYHSIIDELESTRESLSLEKGLLEEFIKQAEEKKKSLAEAKSAKEVLLSRIKSQAALHHQALVELEDATQALTTSLLSMKEQERIYDQGFLINKGKLIPPVTGTISTLFNEERLNKFGIKRKNPGISIEAVDGTQVRAIYDGKVIFSGYLRGYGNTVIIDHGYNYFTITSRIERLLVKKNTKVKKYDIIGIMGSTATILDSGLYFEIRLKDTPLDPLDWLDKKKLTFAEGKKPST